MTMRAGSFVELEPVCVFALHGTGMFCRTLPAQPHPGVLSASRSHAERLYQQACEMRNDFHTRLHGSPRATPALSLGNAPHEDTIGATAVEIPFYHHVAFSQSYYALS